MDEMSDIFNLVNKGEYTEAYVSGYMGQYYMNHYNFPNIYLSQTPCSSYQLCIGVSRNTDLRLVSILEQMISKLKTADIEDIVYQNTVTESTLSFWLLVRQNPIEFMIPIVSFFIIVIAVLLLFFLKMRRLNKLIFNEKNKYKEISVLDGLSQTYNNEAFKQITKEYIFRSDFTPSGFFLICDIDNFKYINDNYGHFTGDSVIKELGRLLKKTFREIDYVGRIGGDEFSVLIKGITGRDDIVQYCEELQFNCQTINEICGINCPITLSIGCTAFTGQVPFEELFQTADKALYEVKKKGKNSYEISFEMKQKNSVLM